MMTSELSWCDLFQVVGLENATPCGCWLLSLLMTNIMQFVVITMSVLIDSRVIGACTYFFE